MLVTTSDGTFEHILPGDGSDHELDPDCFCRPALAREAGVPDSRILMHFERPQSA